MTGIATVSEGEALHWYGGGKTELTTSSNLGVTYGAKTEVVVGFKNEFTLAGQTGISVGSKFEASLALEMSIKKNAAVESAEDGEFYFMDSYVGTVGASAAQLAAVKTLRTATFILLATQTTAMVLATANATSAKVMAPTSKEEIKVPGTDFNLGYMTSIFTIAATIAPALMVVYGKLKGLGENNNPNGVFSMDTVGNIFLGARATVGTNATSGVTVDTTKVQLSSSDTDLVYRRPGGASVLGFTRDAGTATTGGSRLEVRNDGTTAIFGKTLSAQLINTTGASLAEIKAQKHNLAVTASGSTAAAGPALTLDATGGLLKFSNDNSVAVNSAGVRATAGAVAGSSLTLNADSASMGAGGNNLTINSTGVILTFGQSKVQISAAGISFGNAMTVMNPTAPGLSFAGLQQAVQDIAALNLAAQTTATQAVLNAQKFNAIDATTQRLNDTLVSTRKRLKTVAARAFSKP